VLPSPPGLVFPRFPVFSRSPLLGPLLRSVLRFPPSPLFESPHHPTFWLELTFTFGGILRLLFPFPRGSTPRFCLTVFPSFSPAVRKKFSSTPHPGGDSASAFLFPLGSTFVTSFFQIFSFSSLFFFFWRYFRRFKESVLPVTASLFSSKPWSCLFPVCRF